ncbi:chemotaxis protein CheD [Rhizobium sp. CG5]|uniref:chemotaxis protein CheD n=1 Tax=Rhizobium sp. CG5 TaxID=2726076 RepID=UPI002033717E|nr:chemotaxis protein CheD [Rhizobium sp. CG5]MCM2474908.1 chemotaxis protein CheD [Rhizobium sp. CG5]
MAFKVYGGTTTPASVRPVRRVTIGQGQYEVLDDPDAVITTILGSCVAACIRDVRRGFGGMNHFVLPGPQHKSKSPGDPARYGDYLMELLVDEMFKRGSSRNCLEAKIFGGASPLNAFSTVGLQNAAFARDFLAEKGIAVVEVNVGGPYGCKLDYWPVSGKTRHTLLTGL